MGTFVRQPVSKQLYTAVSANWLSEKSARGNDDWYEVPYSLHRSRNFENGGFTLKMRQMFSAHTTPEEFKNATITVPAILDFCLKKTRSGKSRDSHDVIVFEKLCFQNDFR